MASFGNMFDPSELIKKTVKTASNIIPSAVDTAVSTVKNRPTNTMPIESTGSAKTTNTMTTIPAPVAPPAPITPSVTPPGGLGGSTGAGIEKSIADKAAPTPVEPPKPPDSTAGATGAGIEKSIAEKKAKDAPKEEAGVATITDTMTDMDGNPLVKDTEGKYVPLIDPDDVEKVDLDANSDLKQILDIVKGWASGSVDDNVYEKALNNSIARFGLYNQAQQNALQQQIAQDPNLRGSGLAYGLLSLLGREQGLTAGDMLGKLSVKNAENLMAMQKFGITAFQALEKQSYARNKEGINTLIDNGQYGPAAKGLENLLKETTGMNVTIDPIMLAARDPFTIDKLTNAWNMLDEFIDPDNPQLAIDYLNNNILNDPAFAEIMPGLADMNAEQIVQGRLDGSTMVRLKTNDALLSKVNDIKADGGSFIDVMDLYDDLQGMKEVHIKSGENFIMDGNNYDLDNLDILNEWLRENNMSEFRINDDGVLEDSEGSTIGEDDFQQIGQMKDWYGREPEDWFDTRVASLKEIVLKDPAYADYLGDEQALAAIDQVIYNYVAGNGGEIDPDTNLMLPPEGDMFDMLANPDYYHVFYDWGAAVFDADGNVIGDMYPGGEIRDPSYEPQVDMHGNITNSEAQKVKEDERLDKLFSVYRGKGGELNGQQWFLQSQGGKVTVGTNTGFDVEKYGEYVAGDFKDPDPDPDPTKFTPGEYNFLEPVTKVDSQMITTDEERDYKDNVMNDWAITYQESSSTSWDKAYEALKYGAMTGQDPNTMPVGQGQISDYLTANPNGFIIKDGMLYKVIDDKNNDNRLKRLSSSVGRTSKHTDYIHLQTHDGIDIWIDDKGRQWFKDPVVYGDNYQEDGTRGTDEDFRYRTIFSLEDKGSISTNNFSLTDMDTETRNQLKALIEINSDPGYAKINWDDFQEATKGLNEDQLRQATDWATSQESLNGKYPTTEQFTKAFNDYIKIKSVIPNVSGTIDGSNLDGSPAENTEKVFNITGGA